MTAGEALTKAIALVAEAVRNLDRAEVVLLGLDLEHSARTCKKTADEAAELLTRLVTIAADIPEQVQTTRGDTGPEPEPIRYPSGHFPWSPPHMESHPDDKEQT